MSKKKNNKQKYRMSKHDFVETICKKCGICTSGNPELCFYATYSVNPRKFMSSVYPKVIEKGDYFAAIGYGDVATECLDEDIMSLLTEAFCETNSCGMSEDGHCVNMIGCLSSLRNQIRGAGRQVKTERKLTLPDKGNKYPKLSKKERKLQRIIAAVKESTPTFFCSKNFEEEVDRLLNGDDNREQNTA